MFLSLWALEFELPGKVAPSGRLRRSVLEISNA